jgi:hypothetical protein
MSYGLIYTIPFTSRLNNSYQVNIEKENYTGSSTELQGAGSETFVVDIDEPDNDFRYTPTIGSTAKIKIIGSDYLQSLFSDDYQQFRVTLLKNNTVVWRGFIKPENYTQDYVNNIFELDIDCLSGINILQYIQYTQQGTDERIFVSLWDLIKLIISELKLNYNAMYIPHVYSDTEANYAAYDNVLAKMKVSEQNFFTNTNDTDSTPTTDESTGTTSTDTSTEEAWYLNDILENICKLLNWTCVDWNGSLYFIDPDWSGEYLKYTSDLSSYSIVSYLTALNVQNISFAGSDHKLDILPTYNKISVKDSNYELDEIIPEEVYNTTFDTSTLNYQIGEADTVGINYMLKVYQTPTVFSLLEKYLTFEQYDNAYNSSENNFDSIKQPLIQLARICYYSYSSYKDADGNTKYKCSIDTISYENCIEINLKRTITIREYAQDTYIQDVYQTESFSVTDPILTYKSKLPCVSYGTGAFYISGSVGQSTNALEGNSENAMYFFDSETGSKKDINLICELSISGMYYNGSTWQSTQCTFKVSVSPTGYGFTEIDNNTTPFSPYVSGSGYLIQLPSTPLNGAVNFKMYMPECDSEVAAVYIKDFTVKYIKKTTTDSDDSNTYDRIYKNNTLTYRFTKELDEIEFKICSDNSDGVCYSKVILGNNFLTNNLYSAIDKATIRPEEKLINRIVNFYNATKIKLTQVLQESDSITPISTFTDLYMTGKTFSMFCGNIDFQNDSFSVIMLEQ